MRHPTRFQEIELGEIAPGAGWSYFSTETSSRVGPVYKTKAEALADLTRYARESWGLDQAHAPTLKASLSQLQDRPIAEVKNGRIVKTFKINK